MKSFATSVIALAIALALGGAAYAQGRHDEKPHGMSKAGPSPESPVTERTPGRHDDRPHAPAKKTKKTDTKKADDKKAN